MKTARQPLKFSSVQCALACGSMNALALLVSFLLMELAEFSFAQSTLIGSLFVLASVVPFSKAQQAHAAEMALLKT
jgi:hypothetical protein